MYCHAMKAFCSAFLLLSVLAACSDEKSDSPKPAAAQTEPTSTAAQPSAPTSPDPGGSAGEPVNAVWVGQVKIDAHAGTATLNYVGAESGDFVPMRFRTDSEVGAKILAECGDEDLCEIEGSVRFLDEPPPENASAVGEIVRVERVKKLPPDAR